MNGSLEKDEEGEVMIVEIADCPDASAPRRSRRCVQKKLDFLGPRDNGDDPPDDDDESDSDKKGKRKRRGKEKAVAPKKVPSSRKESLESNSRASDFFLKVSEKKLQRKQEIEQGVGSSFGIGCNKSSEHVDGDKINQESCGQVKDLAICKDATPKRSKSAFSRKKLSNAESTPTKSPGTKIIDMNQPPVDLWFKAKVDAEENQRLSAGKQIHPFFSSWKTSKKIVETPEIGQSNSKCHQGFGSVFLPIHVFDAHEEMKISCNWSNWSLGDISLLTSSGYSASQFSTTAAFEGSVEPLKFQTYTPISYLELNKDCSTDQKMDPVEKSKMETTFLSSNGQGNQCMLLSYLKKTHASGNSHQSGVCFSANNNSDYVEDKLLLERLISYQHHRGYNSDKHLWTNKYQPEKAIEVCGNLDAVKIISDWLQCWHDQYHQRSRTYGREENSKNTISNCSLFESYCESESEGEEDLLGNVLLVTGPIGCGKSAAIYACAKEQGFEVIEVNTSEQRNGTLVKQKFGEATESHGLDIRLMKDHTDRERSQAFNLNLGCDGNKGTTVDVPEVISWSCNQDIRVHDFQENVITIDSKSTICQVTNRSLLLFEDVDTVFEEDRGFLGMIMQLAETSKRPIILTTNSKDPGLPRLLVKQVVDFALPSHEELLSLMSMICAAEEVPISPKLLRRFIKTCQADIRKTILHLQFWCQGKEGRGTCSAYSSPSQFDIHAAHAVVQRIFPWSFPCKLSEMIAEVTKTSSSTKEDPFPIDAGKQEKCGSANDFGHPDIVSTEIYVGRSDGVVLKRSIVNFKGTLSPLNDSDTSDISYSPVKFTRRRKQHKYDNMISSESGDEHPKVFETLGNGCQLDANILSPDVSSIPHSMSIDCHDNLHELINQSENQELSQSIFPIPGTRNDNCTWGNDISVNVSCVPESVLYTEVDCGEASSPLRSLHTFNAARDWKVTYRSTNSPSKMENTCLYTESVHGTEDLQDFQIGNSDFLNTGGQFVDECSRADFGVGSAPGKINNLAAGETVQETWTRLRDSQHLKSYLVNDQKIASQTLKLITRITSLISDADTMLSCCSFLTNDIVPSKMLPCTEPHSMSWHDQQVEIASIFGQHGLCHYANACLKLDQKVPVGKAIALSHEILGCSSSLMVLGKLLSLESNDATTEDLHMSALVWDSCLEREVEVKFCNAVLPIIPLRTCMSLKGQALHEYISSLSHISKLENSRLSLITGERRRKRARASQHYLQSYPLSLSPEETTMLAQQCCFGRVGFGRG